jgi:hypothetical protein
MAGLGPAPLAAAILADLGAEIIRLQRVRDPGAGEVRETLHAMMRGRRSIGIDLHQEAGTAVLLRLVEDCDVLIEPFRPGVMERLGIGPEVCLARNPNLLFVRMTGYGQDGPLASKAGHDINYLALAGVPVPPAHRRLRRSPWWETSVAAPCSCRAGEALRREVPNPHQGRVGAAFRPAPARRGVLNRPSAVSPCRCPGWTSWR